MAAHVSGSKTVEEFYNRIVEKRVAASKWNLTAAASKVKTKK